MRPGGRVRELWVDEAQASLDDIDIRAIDRIDDIH